MENDEFLVFITALDFLQLRELRVVYAKLSRIESDNDNWKERVKFIDERLKEIKVKSN